MNFTPTPDAILLVAGVLLSLLFSYVPGFATWYNGQTSDYKRVVMLILLLAVTGAVFGLSCANVLIGVQCTQEGVWNILTAFIGAVIANQAADRISPKIGLKGTLPATTAAK